jgi:hypothetical protein
MDPAEIAKIIPREVAEKAYDDALAPVLKQIGLLGEDVAKTARLILFPLQVAAAWQERFARHCKTIADKIPEERRVEPPVELVTEVLRRLPWLDDSNPVAEMYWRLLETSVDQDTSKLCHPAFLSALASMAPDEVRLLSAIYRIALKSEAIAGTDSLLAFGLGAMTYEEIDWPKLGEPELLSTLAFPDRLSFSFSQLFRLDLVESDSLWNLSISGLGIELCRACKVPGP